MLDANLYSIELYKQEISIEEFNSIVAVFRYLCIKNGVSFLAVLSTTDSLFAISYFEKSGKRGRPRRKVYGKKVEPHIHTALVGTADKSAFSVCQEICKRLKNKHKIESKIVSKGREQHAYNYVRYCFNQADISRSFGDFDFATMERKDKR